MLLLCSLTQTIHSSPVIFFFGCTKVHYTGIYLQRLPQIFKTSEVGSYSLTLNYNVNRNILVYSCLSNNDALPLSKSCE